MSYFCRAVFILLLWSMVLPSQAGLNDEKGELVVEVTNFDGQWVYLKDKSGTNYKFPRNKFRQKKIKIHESILIHSEAVEAFKVKVKKKKKSKPKQG